MSYLALARKWRPKTFAEMVGQAHVLKVLAHALDRDSVHHAFLFTGTRGVGKTTVARILAKCLNCERGVGSTPCGECAACREIDAGRFVDLIEVDAASRTKVDETRELLDNVQYLPTRGRCKVYLIDEVHMLSTHSFNALLKTLEEPPPHVKFLLATTDPHKVPATVLSRCLQLNLKRLPVSLIAERLRHVLAAEGIEAEPAAVRLVAIAADGSLRDALSLLDQLVAFGGGRVGEADARAMLGTIDREHVVRIAELLAAQDAGALLAYVRSLEERAPDHARVLDELAALLQRVAVRQAVPDYEGDEPHAPEVVQRLAAQLAPEDVQLWYQTAILGRRDLAWAPDTRTGFEMTLLRMLLFRPEGAPGPVRAVPAGTTTAAGARPLLAAASTAHADTSAPAARAPLAPESWAAVVAELDLQGAARQLASHSALLSHEQSLVRLALEPRHQLLRTRAAEERLLQALARRLGAAVRLEFVLTERSAETPARVTERAAAAELQAARAAFARDATVAALEQQLDAVVVPDSVRPAR